MEEGQGISDENNAVLNLIAKMKKDDGRSPTFGEQTHLKSEGDSEKITGKDILKAMKNVKNGVSVNDIIKASMTRMKKIESPKKYMGRTERDILKEFQNRLNANKFTAVADAVS